LHRADLAQPAHRGVIAPAAMNKFSDRGRSDLRMLRRGGTMADLASGSERRRGLRVPVRGVAVFYGDDGATYGAIENLSTTGVLVTLGGHALDERDLVNVELKLGVESGWVAARAVRVERGRLAVAFDDVAPELRASIDAAIEAALRAAQRRPVLVIDERIGRRKDLVTRLAARGMTPLAPRTPLEAVDMLARTQLHVDVCLVAASFGQTTSELRTFVNYSFPWVSTAEISDDLDASVDRAETAWGTSDVGRLVRFSA
jgi:hypothetical protein